MDSKAQNLRIRIRQNASVKEKTLIRVVAETLKKLVQIYQIKNAEEILSSFEIQALRYKLKECLNRLIFLEPLEFGQKAEDTIWKSIFYEPIRIFKRELKNKPNLINSKSLIIVAFQRHVLGAIGYYQKLILRLQTEFELLPEMCPDFKKFIPCNSTEEEKEISTELKSWAFSCIQHSLLYIGDLYRYKHDMKCTHSRILATRYYNQVLSLNPSLGHAYNQLATLDTLSYYGLNAAYFYLKAQLCPNSFSQAKENLLILFERNVKRLRSVLDRESMMKKSGSNITKSGLKIMRVKSSIIKFLNVWYSFASLNDMSNYDIKQLAAMSDDVLNILSFVLGFDRKLVSNLSSTDNGVRPSTLNVKIVTQMLFITDSCLNIMLPKKEDQDTDVEQLKQISLKFDLAHSFALNLYGHVFNQCLVRIRDELRTSNIDISLLFHRNENNEEISVINEACDEIDSNKSTVAISTDQNIVKSRKKRVGLSKRLVRQRHDTDEASIEEDLSEDDQILSENDNVLWDDQISDSSDSNVGDEGGFGFSDVEDETDFESNEEIHSQDEDDQIIRAIVGHNTIFGRNQSINGKDLKKSREKESANNTLLNKVIFSETLIHESSESIKPPKRRSATSQGIFNQFNNVNPSAEALVTCIFNVDLLQSTSVIISAFNRLINDKLESFCRVWQYAPYLWKHFAVMLNFCENILDELEQNDITGIKCNHANVKIRLLPPCYLPEDAELNLLSAEDIDQSIVHCENSLHQVVTRALRIIQCAESIASISQGPIALQKINSSNLWLFSYSHNSPRTNLVFKSWTQIFSNSDSHLQGNPISVAISTINNSITSSSTATGSTVDKEKVMREMARLRLKNELSSSAESDDNRDLETNTRKKGSRSPSSDAIRAVYLIPDVDYICSRLDAIKSLIRCQRYIFVIPQAVIQRLDRIKSHDHGARQAIKYFEGEMELNNEHIKIESAATLNNQDLTCEHILDWPAIETSATRLVEESFLKSALTHAVVVTILTNSAAKLSSQFMNHYSTKRINFQSTIDL